MSPMVFFYIFLAVIATFAIISLGILRWQKKQMQLRLPTEFIFLRAPGETLRKQREDLLEHLMSWLWLGSPIAIVLFIVPFWFRQYLPPDNDLFILISGVVLFLIGAYIIISRTVRLGIKGRNLFQGYLGERWIGERLHPLTQAGYTVFHDIPVDFAGGKANIDHLAIGPRGAVVIETKTYSKPTNHKGGPLHVAFDGRSLKWPRYDADTKPLWQVKKNAEWLQAFIARQCHFTIPVATVIAIPGWNVKEMVLTEPRVVTGSGVADAALHAIKADNAPILSPRQIKEVTQALDSLCRDVTP